MALWRDAIIVIGKKNNGEYDIVTFSIYIIYVLYLLIFQKSINCCKYVAKNFSSCMFFIKDFVCRFLRL